jgi:hypothetical protein
MNNERKLMKPLLAKPIREKADAQYHNEADHTLRELWRSTAVLRDVLDRGKLLSVPELRLLENHFQVLQMTYVLWKRR